MTSLREKPEQGLPLFIAEELKRLIDTGVLKPGERLNEAALALRMGTSRGPIREAIRMLTGLGIVKAVVNRGVFVRQISVREMLEIYELRALVFGFAAERATEHVTEDHKQQFEQLLAQMDAACETEDADRYYGLNLQFHALVMRLSNNQRAQETYDDYVKELHLFRRRYFNSPGNMRRSNTEHRTIYEAIVKGATARAKSAAERHVLSGRQRLLASIDDSSPLSSQ
ncbi:FCD domain-containing protein [Polaromonas sp.]|jgi:DNA-binding GntR family transcriptional regulator|uniref:GntR family transcriptional regulator n=1 Tax=Polaromonas sp. TaxID=1869339 RepID=UPI002BC4F117|nr:FCD domain-containing protein [Polaromonas sp.]HQS30877.1 FCD domain-containing protein [Polaromonas sp.]HQS92415.1 FCD domain-containing protein [Polaromonas sp.]